MRVQTIVYLLSKYLELIRYYLMPHQRHYMSLPLLMISLFIEFIRVGVKCDGRGEKCLDKEHSASSTLA